MQRAIISDTSCLILLDKINELQILHSLFGTIVTTQDIVAEFGNVLPEWVEINDPADKDYQTIIEATLDKGEASAIALAVEYDDCLLIIDDLKGRKYAQELGLNITGTLGVLIDAKLAGYIPSLKFVLDKIRKTNFRISDSLITTILTRVGE
jgi:predicted nucleic acid-binding protein